jgi:uncharacterized membrane protein YdbT with pleckstrin-like domain
VTSRLGFPRELLADHEEIVFELRPHWVALLPPGLAGTLIVLVGVVVVGIIDNPIGRTVTALVIVALLLLVVLPGALRWHFTLFVLTSDRLITRSGIFAKRSKEIPLERINDVTFNQSVVERLFGAGDLLVESAGERGQTRITNVRKPEQVQLMIYRTSEDNSNRMMQGRPAATETGDSIPEQIEALARLKERGMITEDEFEVKKKDLLDRM